MKTSILSVYSEPTGVEQLREAIHGLMLDRPPVKIMHVCGSHEHEIIRYGLRQLLPNNLTIVSGPGCPVCICPVEDIDLAIEMAQRPQTTVCTFGDMIRVPASRSSLEQARREGASVEMVYSPTDVLRLALANPSRTFVFFSIGFETTIIGVAALLRAGVPNNLKIILANRYTPPALGHLMQVHQQSIHGFLLPGHACVITGLEPYRFMEDRYKLPCVVTGFEPIDILRGLLEVLISIREQCNRVKNAYPRAVKPEGNVSAQKLIMQVFDRCDGNWRGIGSIPQSAFQFKNEYAFADARKTIQSQASLPSQQHPRACICHKIMLAEKTPKDCRLFGEACQPSHPYGPCMVSSEGTCHAWFNES